MKSLFFNFRKSKYSPDINLFDKLNIKKNPRINETPVFAVGVGRSGTHFLTKVFDKNTRINSYHLDNINRTVGDSFLFYSKWYNLNVDLNNFFNSRDFLINESIRNNRLYFESNPYLALSVDDITDYYKKPKIIYIHRDPRKVVLSHLNKGWYKESSINKATINKAPGYNYFFEMPNHFFGRISPVEVEELDKWLNLTQVGKIAWMWKTINNKILQDIDLIPSNRLFVQKIEDFDYGRYIELCSFMNVDNDLNKLEFEKIIQRKPGKTISKKYIGWGEKEEIEFLNEVNQIAFK